LQNTGARYRYRYGIRVVSVSEPPGNLGSLREWGRACDHCPWQE